MDKKLISKLDLMIERMSPKRKADNVLIVEGLEGDGKTNMSLACGYYVAFTTKREFSNENVYFDLEKMIKKAQSTEEQVLIWDEPALAGLNNEWWRKTQQNLIKLLMVARKKKHFFIFNFTKFYKFSEYIVVDRAIGMIHMYSRNGVQAGRWVYFKKESLERLYFYWKGTKRRAYKKFYDFRGSVPWVLPKIIDESAYEKEKDKAIMSVGGYQDKKKEYSREDEEYFIKKFEQNRLKAGLKVKQKDIAVIFDRSPETIRKYSKEIMLNSPN